MLEDGEELLQKTKTISLEEKPVDVASFLDRVKRDRVQFVRLQFTDLFGALKSVTIVSRQLEESVSNGTWFDGSSIAGFAPIHESDMILMPDASSYAVLPWKSGDETVARMMCDVHTARGKPFDGDPRSVLKRSLQKAESLGYAFNTGPELEFFLFKPNGAVGHGFHPWEPHDNASYFDAPFRDAAADVRKSIVLALEKMGLQVEMLHHEVAPGQHEIDFRFSDALRTADNAITLKSVVKTVAQQNGLHASFMPKPVFGINGSGMHVHQSLFDSKGNNAFYDASADGGVSETCKQFMAGQLAQARSFCAVTAPTVNSYKRLVPGYEAPVYIAWSHRNRSALVRIPAHANGNSNAQRIELRCPDPSCNPYLAFSVLLESGLDGIRNKMVAPPSCDENLYELSARQREALGVLTLPSSLHEALQEFRQSGLMKQALGEFLFNQYIQEKEKEWDNYRTHVTDWETRRYFDSL